MLKTTYEFLYAWKFIKSEYEINFQYSIYFMITKILILTFLALKFQNINVNIICMVA